MKGKRNAQKGKGEGKGSARQRGGGREVPENPLKGRKGAGDHVGRPFQRRRNGDYSSSGGIFKGGPCPFTNPEEVFVSHTRSSTASRDNVLVLCLPMSGPGVQQTGKETDTAAAIET